MQCRISSTGNGYTMEKLTVELLSFAYLISGLSHLPLAELCPPDLAGVSLRQFGDKLYGPGYLYGAVVFLT